MSIYGIKAHGDIVNSATGAFYRIDEDGNPTAGPHAPAFRLSGRALIGENWEHNLGVDGQNPDGSWLQAVSGGRYNYYEDNARLSVVSSFGIGIASAVRMALAGSGTPDGIAIAGHGRNDLSNTDADLWVAYLDGVKVFSGAGDTKTLEVQIANLPGPSPQGGLDPYKSFVNGKTVGASIAAGADASVHGPSFAVDVGLQFANNGAVMHTGINFRWNAIRREGQADTAGASGHHDSYARAIAFAHKQGMSFFSREADGLGDRKEVTRILSSTNSPTNYATLEFADEGMIYRSNMPGGFDAESDPMFQVDLVAGGDNYLAVSAAQLGAPPALRARGNSTNINLRLRPKGTGVVQFGYDAEAASTPGDFSADWLAEISFDNQVGFIPIMLAKW